MLIQPHFVDVVALSSWCLSMTYSFLRKFQHAQIVLEGKAADLVRSWHVDLRENLRNYPAGHREQHSGCSFVGVLAFQVMAYRQSDRRSIKLARLKNIGPSGDISRASRLVVRVFHLHMD